MIPDDLLFLQQEDFLLLINEEASKPIPDKGRLAYLGALYGLQFDRSYKLPIDIDFYTSREMRIRAIADITKQNMTQVQ